MRDNKSVFALIVKAYIQLFDDAPYRDQWWSDKSIIEAIQKSLDIPLLLSYKMPFILRMFNSTMSSWPGLSGIDLHKSPNDAGYYRMKMWIRDNNSYHRFYYISSKQKLIPYELDIKNVPKRFEAIWSSRRYSVRINHKKRKLNFDADEAVDNDPLEILQFSLLSLPASQQDNETVASDCTLLSSPASQQSNDNGPSDCMSYW
jgi:hypothetical protein